MEPRADARAEALAALEAAFDDKALPKSAKGEAMEYMVRHQRVSPDDPLVMAYIDLLRTKSQINGTLDAAVTRMESAANSIRDYRPTAPNVSLDEKQLAHVITEVTSRLSSATYRSPSEVTIKAACEAAVKEAFERVAAVDDVKPYRVLLPAVVASLKRDIDPEKRGSFIIGFVVAAVFALVGNVLELHAISVHLH